MMKKKVFYAKVISLHLLVVRFLGFFHLRLLCVFILL